MLRTLSNGANGRLQIEVGGMKLGFFRRGTARNPDRWVRRIRHAKLAAKERRRYREL